MFSKVKQKYLRIKIIIFLCVSALLTNRLTNSREKVFNRFGQVLRSIHWVRKIKMSIRWGKFCWELSVVQWFDDADCLSFSQGSQLAYNRNHLSSHCLLGINSG